MATVRSSEDGSAPTGAAPTLGLVLAGTALAATFLPWAGADPLVTIEAVDGSALAAGLALVATGAFALRRHGALDRSVGSVVAGLFCFGVATVAVYRLVQPAVEGSPPEIGLGLPLAAVATLGGIAVAVADWLALPDDSVWQRVQGFGAATLIGFLGLFVSGLFASLAGSLALPLGRNVAFSVSTAGAGLGLGVFTLAYLQFRDLDWSYVDLAWPGARDVKYAVGGLVALFVGMGAISMTLRQIGISPAVSGIQETAAGMDDPLFLLALVPLSWLAIAPGEELVFRNIVQKYLYDSFSRPAAVVMSSLAFGAIHFQQYSSPNPVSTLATLFVVFVLSLVLGWTYYRTENLLVPIAIHGTFNAIQFAGLYFSMTGGIPSL